jgi:hypothetical protein
VSNRFEQCTSRFRRLCETSGFAENFDALTGEGLRDRAYTWTASTYLALAADAVRRQADGGTFVTPDAQGAYDDVPIS